MIYQVHPVLGVDAEGTDARTGLKSN